MAPKKRQTRMHAAIDAMRPLGFSSQVVQATVKSLLKEYGGEDNWPFIEADAYMILINAMTEDNESCHEEENSSVDENMHDDSREGRYIAAATTEYGGTDAGTSKLALSHAHTETVNTVLPISQIGYKNTASIPVKMPEHTPIASESPKLLSFSRVKNLKPQPENLIKPKSQNSNGWICEDDDEVDDNELKIADLSQTKIGAKLKRKHIEP